MSSQYVKTLLDPFDTSVIQPKILDGSVTRSAGLRFRTTGTIALDKTGADNWIVLFPGLSNNMSTKIAAAAAVAGTAFPDHLGTTALRSGIKAARLVTTALKLQLLNSSDDNEGYWEAVRIPIDEANFTLADVTAPNGEDMRVNFSANFPTGLANYQSFQTGRLRDIDRFFFKLNSVAPVHPWKRIPLAATVPTVSDCLDSSFDVVVIRIVGRIDTAIPSTLMYDVCTATEVDYAENTVPARLHTMSYMVPQTDVLYDRTRFALPAVQVK